MGRSPVPRFCLTANSGGKVCGGKGVRGGVLLPARASGLVVDGLEDRQKQQIKKLPVEGCFGLNNGEKKHTNFKVDSGRKKNALHGNSIPSEH